MPKLSPKFVCVFVFVCVQSLFVQGGVIVLQSVTSGRTLCIYDGRVSGKGIRDAYCKERQDNTHTHTLITKSLNYFSVCICIAQFIVHVRSPGKIALQNVAHADNWLGIYEGRALGSVSHL